MSGSQPSRATPAKPAGRRGLRREFLLLSGLIVLVTLLSGGWAAILFNSMNSLLNRTVIDTREVLNFSSMLLNTLEREDDALLIALTGNLAAAKIELQRQRTIFDEQREKLAQQITSAENETLLTELNEAVAHYRATGDQMLSGHADHNLSEFYHRQVNPALRVSLNRSAQLRESLYRDMVQTTVAARDQARKGTITVIGLSLGALLITLFLTWRLGRGVVEPLRSLTQGVEAISQGNFQSRLEHSTLEELHRLGVGFNRMAIKLEAYRKSSLGELLQAKSTLESIIASIPSAVIVIDTDNCVEQANPLGWQVLGDTGDRAKKPLQDYQLPAQVETLLEKVRLGQSVNPPGANLDQAVTISINGLPRKLLLSVASITDFHDDLYGYVLVFDDVTDLARLDELRSELVAVASHELKTPLTTLKMNLLMLSERPADLSQQQLSMIQAAIDGTNELAATIEEMLDLTRIESGQLRLRNEPVDFEGVLEETLQSLRPRFDDSGIKLNVLQQTGPLQLMGDAIRLKLVLANLLGNALKYTPSGKTVEVQTRFRPHCPTVASSSTTESGWLEVAILDEGKGVPPEFRQRIFEKFFRVEHHTPAESAAAENEHPPGGSPSLTSSLLLSRTANQGGVRGTGIGLFLCQQIIQAHGGTITCQARTAEPLPFPGNTQHLSSSGACFLFQLPAQRS